MKNKYIIIFFFLFISRISFAQGSQFIGEVKIFAGNFAPSGWAFCNGQLLSIVQNSALFVLLGTTYGGDGQTTFGLPDLRDRMVMGSGSGAVLSPRILGETGGATSVTLTTNNLPAHTHTAALKVNNTAGTLNSPVNGVSLATATDTFNGVSRPVSKYNSSASDTTLIITNTAITGGTNSVNIEQPKIVCNYIIALTGIFPQRF